MRTLILAGVVLMIFISWNRKEVFERKDKLSEYGFFSGNLSSLHPVDGVLRYELNTPLFSNYAEKLRFIRLPKNTKIAYNDSVAFDFPEGTVLIKNFYYPKDFRKPEKGRKIMETRLLVLETNGWQAYPYIWNDEQTEAFYDPAGETKTISFVNPAGKKVTTPYVIPNKNQCKGCHIRQERMMPIGLTARQLNRPSPTDNTVNQLHDWSARDMINAMPVLEKVPKSSVWNDPTTGNLNDRARAYLDVNCAHCHSRKGPASTSGLFLDIFEKDPTHLGVNKPPVAAGRGAGDLQFDIKPGDPDHSIMIFRMKTVDPAIAMPEIGREQIHKEGVALIEEWIRNNVPKAP
jgi:uncharacterized repeat protein (TIGR03806 family)